MRHTLPFIVKLNLSMHQTVKTLFRLFFAMLIFLITLALFISLYAKGKEIINAEQAFQQAKIVSLKSNEFRRRDAASDVTTCEDYGTQAASDRADR